jgi:hypothetical protein
LPGWNEQIRGANQIDKPANTGIFTEKNRLEIDDTATARVSESEQRAQTPLYLDDQQSNDTNLDDLVEQKFIPLTEKFKTNL